MASIAAGGRHHRTVVRKAVVPAVFNPRLRQRHHGQHRRRRSFDSSWDTSMTTFSSVIDTPPSEIDSDVQSLRTVQGFGRIGGASLVVEKDMKDLLNCFMSLNRRDLRQFHFQIKSSSRTMVIDTIYDHQCDSHVWFCIQNDRLSTKPTLLELSIPKSTFIQEMQCDLVRVALEFTAAAGGNGCSAAIDLSNAKPSPDRGSAKKKSPPEKSLINEFSLDNPDLGPFLLKLARDMIASGERPVKSLDYALRVSKSFKICTVDGEPSLDLAMSLHVVAAIYYSLGRFEEAFPVLERGIRVPEVSRGADHALAVFSGYMQLGIRIRCWESLKGLKYRWRQSIALPIGLRHAPIGPISSLPEFSKPSIAK